MAFSARLAPLMLIDFAACISSNPAHLKRARIGDQVIAFRWLLNSAIAATLLLGSALAIWVGVSPERRKAFWEIFWMHESAPQPRVELTTYDLQNCDRPTLKRSVSCEMSAGGSRIRGVHSQGPLPVALAEELSVDVTRTVSEELELPTPAEGTRSRVVVERRYSITPDPANPWRDTDPYAFRVALQCSVTVRSIETRPCATVSPTPSPQPPIKGSPTQQGQACSIGPDSAIKIALDAEISTTTHTTGKRFTGRLRSLLPDGNGSNRNCVGVTAWGTIVGIAPQQKQAAFVVLQLAGLSSANQRATFESHPLRLEGKKRGLLGSILGGAGAGVVVGGIVDGKKGAARGAALGAAAGAIVGARMQGKHLVLPVGTELTFVVACCQARLQLAN